MKQQTKLSQEQQEIAAHQNQQQAGQEFASAEELLRFDAAQTTVPPQVTERLKNSVARLPPAGPSSGWFKRIFG